MESFGLAEGSKGFAMTWRVGKESTEAEFELEGQEAFEFWAVAARLNFMAQDCTDHQFVSKEASREMSRPTNLSWSKTKRLARYFLSSIPLRVDGE